MKYIKISQIIFTFTPGITDLKPIINNTQANDINNNPKPSFTGIDGSLLLLERNVHKTAITGANVTINNGPKNWNTLGGILYSEK